MRFLVIIMIHMPLMPICRLYIIEAPKNTATKEGNPSSLNCTLSSEHPRSIGSWKFRRIGEATGFEICKGERCTDPNRHTLRMTRKGKYDLVLKITSQSDAGTYFCADREFEENPGAELAVINEQHFFSNISSYDRDVEQGEVIELKQSFDIYEDGELLVEQVEWIGPDKQPVKGNTQIFQICSMEEDKCQGSLFRSSAIVSFSQSPGSYMTKCRLKIDKIGITNNSIEYILNSPVFKVRSTAWESISNIFLCVQIVIFVWLMISSKYSEENMDQKKQD